MNQFFQILIGVGIVNTILGSLQSVRDSEISLLLVGGLLMLVIGFGGFLYLNKFKIKG